MELTYDILDPSELPELPGFKLDPCAPLEWCVLEAEADEETPMAWSCKNKLRATWISGGKSDRML